MMCCAACGKSVPLETMSGSIRGDWTDFTRRYHGNNIILYFCHTCWERMISKGVI